MTDYDFKERLGLANSEEIATKLEAWYRTLWPSLLSIKAIPYSDQRQSLGVDRVIKVAECQVVYIEEKIREKDFGDFLCEEISVFYGENDPRNVVGWTVDDKKISHLVAYYVIPCDQLVMLPAQLLRWTAKQWINSWAATYGRKIASTNGGEWRTINVAVPWSVLWQRMRECSVLGGEITDALDFF